MKFVALFALCSLLFHGGIYPKADADEAIPTALKRSEIVFVDTGVANHNQWLADLQARHLHRPFNVHVLDGRQSGIEQITKVLAGYRDVDAIHVLSHGTNGAVQLGNTWLHMDPLDTHARMVASWQEALSRDADVLFYGCHVARSQQGRRFIQTVSALTGADVAASIDATGHAQLGGNWTLEYAVGSIETDIAPTPQLQADWVSALDLLTFQEGFNAYTSTQDTELDSSSPGTITGTNSEIELDNTPQRVGLIRFDNVFGPGPNQIPFGSIINSATLTVSVSDVSLPGANITLHRMLVDWDETASWTSMGGGIQLDDVEASFLPDSTLSNPDQLGSQTFSGLNATLQAWSNSSPNYGWAMVNDNDRPWKFYSSDELTAGFRPILTVDYTPAIVVTNTNNSGAGSLRQAILDANALGGTDTITFNIPRTDSKHHYYRDDGIAGSLSVIATTVLDDASISDFDPDYPGTPRSWYTITLNSALPDIDDPMVLDATTQPGYVDAPIIELDGSGISSNDSGLSLTADNSTIRGLVINRFNGHGIVLAVGDNNVIEGSYIGSDVSGTIGLGNGEQGIQIDNSAGHTIGGTIPGAGNVISGNGWSGVSIQLGGATNNLIQGNTIGTDPSGTIPVPNALGGIVIEQGATDNTIGGTVADSGNVIAFNSGDGVQLVDPATSANVIHGNSIFSNTGLGIDLNIDGVTSNDDGDGDGGPNRRQNFPVLTSANTDGTANLYLGGIINSTALRTFRIEFFANSAADPSGHGEGETYLGFTTVTTNLLGDRAFSTILPAIVPVGSFITATATDQSTNDTSEFSPHVPVLDLHQVVVDTTDDMADAPDLSSIPALLSNRGGDHLISLREAILATNATSNGATPDEIRFNIPDVDPNHFYYQDDGLVGVLSIIFVTLWDDPLIPDFDPDYPGPGYSWFTIQPVAPLPAITDAVILDGTTQPGFNGKPIIELDGTFTFGSDGLVVGLGGGGTTIRGLVMNRFGNAGIWLHDADGNKIEGNYIGTDVSGTLDHGNVQDGISIENSDDNIIGGSTATTRNVISGNNQHGMLIFNGSNRNISSGNFIGVDVTGTMDLGNSQDGIHITTSDNTIGGTLPGTGNVISGNNDNGIDLNGISATGNNIWGNAIGLDLAGVMNLGNGSHGITIYSAASNNLIGGSAMGEANTIAFSGNDGVMVSGGTRNTLRGNSIHTNGLSASDLGIDLGPNGANTNDPGDGDTGANNLQNAPDITSALTNEADSVVITGTLNSLSGTNFDLDFFYTLAEGGEGQFYLGTIPVLTDGSGNASFNNISFSPFAVPDSAYITVTATVTSGLEAGNTSEFSSDFQATTNTAPVLEPSATPVLNSVDEDAGAPMGAVGTLISALVDFPGGGGHDNVTDADSGAVTGIAVTASDTTNGTWHYTVNSGSTWNSLGAAGVNTARLLAANAGTRIYFQPNPAYNGTVSNAIQFRAWDQITGVNGDIGDTASPGDPSAFSIAIDSADITVTSVANTPSVTNAFTLEDTQTTSGLVISRNIADGPEVTHFKITGISGGTLYHNDGVTVINAGNFISVAEGQAGLKFTPLPNSTANGSFSIQASTESNNGGLGGNIVNATITVTPVGDTPQVASISTLEDTQSGAIGLDRNVNDGPEVTHFKITGISGGTLYHNDGVTVINAGNFISVAEGQAGLKFTPLPDSTAPGAFDVEASEDGLTVAAQSGVATSTITVTPVSDAPLMLTTDNHVTGGGQPGVDTWRKADLIQIADPNLVVEPGTTNGTFSVAASMNTFVSDKNVNAIHYVSTNIQVGASNFQLFAGDLLLASKDAAAFGSLAVSKEDVVVFHPDTPEDYSAGTFTMLLKNPVGAEIRGISLIEQNTLVGDANLQAGDFLFTRSGGGEDSSVWLFETTDVGATSTNGTASVLLEGNDAGINIDKKLFGVDLVETTIMIGSRTLNAGTLLLSIEADGDVGNNSLVVTKHDIFALDVTKTTLVSGDGNGLATASLFFEGGDVAFESGAETLDGLTLTVVNNSATAATNLSAAESYTEDTPLNLADIVISDVDSANVTATLTLSDVGAGSLSTGSSGSVTSTYNGGTGVWTASGALADVNTLLSGVTFVPALNYNSNFTIATSVDDGVAIPLTGVKNMTSIPVGDTPQVANIVTLEDTQSDAIALDRNANDGPEVSHFKITGILGGTLYQNDGVTVINSGDFILVAQGQAGLKFTPSPNSTAPGSFDVESSEDGLTVAVQSGVATATITVMPVGDTPQAASVITFEDTQSGAIILDRHVNDGAEVTHFRISHIVGGTLYYSEGFSVVNEGDFITFAQGHSGLRFTPSMDSTAVGSFDVESSEDGLTVAAQSGIATATISVSPVNDGPSATIALASYAASEDTPLTLHGTGLLVDDPDAGASTVRVTLSAGEGSLTVTAGSTGVSVSGSGSASVTFEGTLAQINDLLAGHLGATITYNAAAATDTVLTLHIDDLGASGSGGLLTATDTATLTIAATTASNSGPMAIRVSHNTIDENTDTSFGYRIGILTAMDPDITDTFAYTIVGGADAAKFSIGGTTANALMLTDGRLDHETTSSYEVTVRVSDSGGLTHDETFIITVIDLATVITVGQSFSVSETDASGAVVGTVGTTGDDPITFAITGGNVNNAFAIDASGTITIADSSALDFDTTSSYTLTVEVSDGTTAVSETVTISVTDVADTPSSGGSESTSSPPSDGEGALIPNAPPDVNPEVDTPESASEDSSISNPTPAEDESPEPQTPNPQVSNSLTPNPQTPIPQTPIPQTPIPPAAAPRPTQPGTDHNSFVPGRNSAPSRTSERVDTPASTSATLAKQTDAETIPVAVLPETDDLRPLIVAAGWFRELDEMRDEIGEDKAFSQVVIGSTLTFATSLSIGYVLWLIRGGVLLSSLLSSLPAWRFVDPLPVLAHLDASAKEDETEDDSLEAVLKGADVANAQPESTSRMNVERNIDPPRGPYRI